MRRAFVKENLTGEIRLNKYLSDAGVCSRREADRLIEAGEVLVDGVRACQGMKIDPGCEVTVKGRPVTRERELILLAVHKPRGVVCTTDTRWGDQTVYEMLDYPKRIFSVGRLDKESEGLLLMTNQGDILNKIMGSGNYHEKEYLVTVDKAVTPDFLKKMAAGVYLRELEVKTRPCRVELAGERQFRIVLTQGLNRQIRRMCEALHYKVTRLIRVRIMNIELGRLKPGEYRSVTRRELAELMEGLKDSVNPGAAPENGAHKPPRSEAQRRMDGSGAAQPRPKTTGESKPPRSEAQKRTDGSGAAQPRPKTTGESKAPQFRQKKTGGSSAEQNRRRR